jgi:hypothetical protein
MQKHADRSSRRRCYRCGKPETHHLPLQLLPGSQHITLCRECCSVVWGWHQQPSSVALEVAPRAEGEPAS